MIDGIVRSIVLCLFTLSCMGMALLDRNAEESPTPDASPAILSLLFQDQLLSIPLSPEVSALRAALILGLGFVRASVHACVRACAPVS